MRCGKNSIATAWSLLVVIYHSQQSIVRIPESIDNEEQMIECMATICQNYFEAGRTLVISGTDFATIMEFRLLQRLHRMEGWPLVVSVASGDAMKRDLLDWDPRNADKHHAYILIVTKQEEAKRHLLQLQTFSAWNPWAKFVVVLNFSSTIVNNEKVVEKVLSDMWELKIIDVVVLVNRFDNIKQNNERTNEISVMTWFPYTLPLVCDQLQNPVTLNSWVPIGKSGQFLYNSSIFPNKIPKDLKGCSLRVGTTNFQPFVILESVENATDSFIIDGVDVRTLLCITKHLNMFITVIPNTEFNPWGSKLENGTWTGMSGYLINNRIDVAVAGWANNLRDHLIFSVTKRYFTDMVKWYVPRAKPYPHWLGIIRVFTPSFWAAFFLGISVSLVFLRLISVKSHKSLDSDSARYSNVLRCMSDLWSVVISSSIQVLPRSIRFRVFFSCWLVYSFVVSTIFQTYVTSLLVDPGFQHQISSVEELIGSDLDFFLMSFLVTFVDEKLLAKLIPTGMLDTPSACLQSAVESGNAVTLLSKSFVINSANEIPFKNKIFPLCALRENFMNFHLVFVFQKGDPLVESFNDVILHLVEAGLPAQFMREITSSKRQTSESLSTDYVAVSVYHLLSALVLMMAGLGFSGVIFLIEVIIPHIRKTVIR